MKVNVEVTIDASLESTWAAFLDERNQARWRNRLTAYRRTSGEQLQPGSVAELVYEDAGNENVVTETVTERRDRQFLAATYVTEGMTTLVVNRFESLDANACRLTAWANINFQGLRKWTSLFSGAALRKNFAADLQRFKLMVESDLASAG